MTAYRISFVGLGLASIAALVVVGVGCSRPEPEPVVEQAPPPPPPPEPNLPTAGDVHLTVFGEMPNHERVPFRAQAASPMTQHTFDSEGADFDVEVTSDGKRLVFASTRNTPRPNLYMKTVNGRAVTQLSDDPAADVQPAISPDGKRVAFASNRAGNWDLWMIDLAGGRPIQVTHSPQHEVHPSFSPDGKQLAYCLFNEQSNQWELWVLNLAQPDSRKMIGLGLFPDWSPKSDSIVYQRARERGGRWFSIWRVDLENGEPRFPVEIASSTKMALIQPNWSPDGEWVTYGTAEVGTTAESTSEISDSGGSMMTRGDVWIVRADGSSTLQLTEAGVNFGSVWGPDNQIYFTSMQNGSENVWSVRILGETAGPTAAAPEAAPVGPPTDTGLQANRGQGG